MSVADPQRTVDQAISRYYLLGVKLDYKYFCIYFVTKKHNDNKICVFKFIYKYKIKIYLKIIHNIIENINIIYIYGKFCLA